MRTTCGRYSLVCTDDLGNRFRVNLPTIGCRSRFSVAPSQAMPVVVRRDQTEMVMMRRGLVPHRAKDLKGPARPAATTGRYNLTSWKISGHGTP